MFGKKALLQWALLVLVPGGNAVSDFPELEAHFEHRVVVTPTYYRRPCDIPAKHDGFRDVQ
jgi:hypothetical protein